MGIERSENNPSRVFDMNASRKIKEATGMVKAIPVSTETESPSFAQHANEAITMGNSGKPARAAASAPQKAKGGKMDKVKKAANYVWKKLDLVDYPDN